ncbi:hypothetical protein AB0F46_01850 [Streptomyces sp. NPDC026665]|uniref:hypothetical protein n=1 Tax=Streptomyces sp. NPDC026665 TaxID=3154798 RepID=UPI0033E44CE3
MISPLDTYLGWEKPEHNPGCKRPSWEIGFRMEEDKFRYRGYGEERPQHKCPDESCEHGNTFKKMVVRIVCKSCGAAHMLTGESTRDTRISTTSAEVLGYGLAPRRVAGLLLWPGHPWLELEELRSDEPHDFVVTRTGVEEVTEDTAVGQITQSRGDRGGIVWTALAVPDPEGQYGYGQRIRWAHANDGRGRGGSPLRSVGSAARWIGARLAEQPAKAVSA